MKVIKLIYDKYENEPVSFSEEMNNYVNNYGIIETTNLEEENISSGTLPIFRYEGEYQKDRKLKIYTWGVKKNTANIDVDLLFDLTVFQTKVSSEVDIPNVNGLFEVIQTSIFRHPKYDTLVEKIINEIEENNAKKVAFVCNHGKHRSVGWAEIIKNHYYPNATVKHELRLVHPPK